MERFFASSNCTLTLYSPSTGGNARQNKVMSIFSSAGTGAMGVSAPKSMIWLPKLICSGVSTAVIVCPSKMIWWKGVVVVVIVAVAVFVVVILAVFVLLIDSFSLFFFLLGLFFLNLAFLSKASQQKQNSHLISLRFPSF